MAEQCSGAIAKGIPEIGITDHFDLHPLDECSGYFKLAAWAAEFDRVRAEFADRLIVRAGIEIGEPHLFQAETRAYWRNIPLIMRWGRCTGWALKWCSIPSILRGLRMKPLAHSSRSWSA